MSNEFKNMLYALRYAAFGENIDINKICNENDVCGLSMEQGVFPLVYYSLINNGCKNISDEYKNAFIAQLFINERKMYYLKKVVDLFNDNGLEFCVLKGYTIGELYYLSQYRISGDTDILINPSDEKKAMRLLSEELEMTVTPRSKNSHHFLAKHKQGGLFEIHIELYNSLFDNEVLKNEFETSRAYKNQKIRNDFCVNTLSVNDNLYFLTAHLFKHFVKEGCGIRQIVDLLVFVNKYKNDLNFDGYFNSLHKISFDKFIKNIFGIGVEYFNLSLPYYETEFADEILYDVESGGSFGFSDEERTGFYNLFLYNRGNKDRAKLKADMEARNAKGILLSVFAPKPRRLINKGYTYLKKSILLYPVAYIHRIANVFILVITKKRGLNNFRLDLSTNDTKTKRMNLMENLDMFGGNNK